MLATLCFYLVIQSAVAKHGSAEWIEKPHDEEATTLKCTVCAHVYDPKKDCGGMAAPTKDCGDGVAFEQLPDDWKCPVCGQGKDKYQPAVANDGSVQWIEKPHEEEAAALKCTVCAHVYDPKKDCGGMDAPTKDCGDGVAFEQLPDDWKCPVCGQGKDKYQPAITTDGSVQWIEKPHEEEAAALKCTVCAHVYDPKKDCGGMAAPTKDCGNGVAFEQLPDDWKCPVCGQGKDKYQPAVANDGSVQWIEKPHDEEAAALKCTVCAHIYDPKKDCGGMDAPTKDCGDGVAFEQLPDDWKCPVCGQGKDKYQPAVAKDGSVQWIEKPHEISV